MAPRFGGTAPTLSRIVGWPCGARRAVAIPAGTGTDGGRRGFPPSAGNHARESSGGRGRDCHVAAPRLLAMTRPGDTRPSRSASLLPCAALRGPAGDRSTWLARTRAGGRRRGDAKAQTAPHPGISRRRCGRKVRAVTTAPSNGARISPSAPGPVGAPKGGRQGVPRSTPPAAANTIREYERSRFPADLASIAHPGIGVEVRLPEPRDLP